LVLRKGEKIIEKIKQWETSALLVGFKLEANLDLDALKARAVDLMNRSGADLVVANRVEDISNQQHIAYLVEKRHDNTVAMSQPLPTRKAIAYELCRRMANRWHALKSES